MFGHPGTFYVQMSIVTHVVTIDILDHFYAAMSIVTDVVTIDILDLFYAQMSSVTDVVPQPPQLKKTTISLRVDH